MAPRFTSMAIKGKEMQLLGLLKVFESPRHQDKLVADVETFCVN
jgi:hypothetical protein